MVWISGQDPALTVRPSRRRSGRWHHLRQRDAHWDMSTPGFWVAADLEGYLVGTGPVRAPLDRAACRGPHRPDKYRATEIHRHCRPVPLPAVHGRLGNSGHIPSGRASHAAGRCCERDALSCKQMRQPVEIASVRNACYPDRSVWVCYQIERCGAHPRRTCRARRNAPRQGQRVDAAAGWLSHVTAHRSAARRRMVR